MPRLRRPITSLRWLLILVAISALWLWVAVQIRDLRQRESRLLDELKAERERAQGFQRLARLAIAPDQTPSLDLRRELDEETERFRAEAARRRLGSKEDKR